MSRWAEALIADVREAFGRTGADHVIVVVAPLIWWTLRTILKESRLSYKSNVAALCALSWSPVCSWRVIITAFTNTILSRVHNERSSTATNSTKIVRKFVIWTRDTSCRII